MLTEQEPRKPRMRQETLLNWVAAGIAVEDAGDGAWCWTEKGRQIPLHIRSLLSDILWNVEIPRYMRGCIVAAGFNPDTGKMLEESSGPNADR